MQASKPQKPRELDLIFQRPTGPGSGQVRHYTNYLLLWAQLCKNWPSPLASPSYYRSWDQRPRTPGLRLPDPRGGVLPTPEIRRGGAAAGHTPGNMKTTCANKAPGPGRPAPSRGPRCTLTLKFTRGECSRTVSGMAACELGQLHHLNTGTKEWTKLEQIYFGEQFPLKGDLYL